MFNTKKTLLYTSGILFIFLSIALSAQAAIPFLTNKGIILQTNKERASAGLSALKSDPSLQALAQQKASDMFKRQYFAHVSPDGDKVGSLAKKQGYKYLLIGENLAFGVFENDADVVKAWMESKGHRSNILDKRYTNIGLAAQKGIYDGEEVCIVVQVLSMPLSTCQKPSASLAQQIEMHKTYYATLKKIFNGYSEEIERISGKDSKVKNFISLYKQFSVLLDIFNKKLNEQISIYNKQVEDYERCAQGGLL